MSFIRELVKINKSRLFILIILSVIYRTIESVTSFTSLPLAAYNDNYGDAQDIELRVAVEPGTQQCFYQDVKLQHNLDLSYQVVEISSRFNWIYTPGFSSDLTIDFIVKAPNGVEIFRESRKKDGQHVYRANQQGVYTICLDNSFSTVSTKVVNLEVYVYSNDDNDDRWGLDSDFTFQPELHYLDTIESIRTSINKVRDDLIRVTREQEIRRAIETRDRNVAEQNYDYVNRFSMLSIAVMIIVGLIQIYMIRSLFENKSYIRKIFKSY